MGAMIESFVLVHEALDRASTREGEFQSLQTRLEKMEGHIRQLEVLKGNLIMEISKLRRRSRRSRG